MTQMKPKPVRPIYRITFINNEDIYEVYAEHIHESDMFGFVVIENFVFGEHTELVVDPSEERLKAEFSQVKRTYIPMHSIVRIDEVAQKGAAKIKSNKSNMANVRSFPGVAVSTSEHD